MPGCVTEVFRSQVMDLYLGGVAVEPPEYLEFGLSQLPSNEAGLVAEPTHPSYQRREMRNDAKTFPPAGLAGGVKLNAGEIRFPKATGDWGEIKSLFVADPLGNVLLMFDAPLGRVGPSRPPVYVPPGWFTWRLP